MKHRLKYIFFIFIFFPFLSPAQLLKAKRGEMDLRHYDFSKDRTVSLSGEWEFYMSELISPDSFKDSLTIPKDFVEFPSTWNESSKSLDPGNGFATYRLKLFLKNDKHLAFELPHFYTSYKLWINSRLVAENGVVGTTEATSIPQWLPQTVLYSGSSDTLDIVIQASNFHHALGGVRGEILLGSAKQLNLKRQLAITSNIALFIILIILGTSFLFLISRKKERSILYFSFLCITWALRSVFSKLYAVTVFYPDFPWEIAVKIEYITLFATMVWATFLLSSLFPTDVNKMFKYFLIGCNTIFIVLTLITNASTYTQFLPVYLSFCMILLVYIIYVLIRAVVYEREGVWLIISCIMLGVILFSYDLIAYQGMAIYNSVIINFGYLLMFMLLGLCMAYQLGIIKRSTKASNILTYEDLYGSTNKK